MCKNRIEQKSAFSNLTVFVAICFLATGCGIFGKKKSSPSPGNPPDGPVLTGEQTKYFEEWKKAPLKSCSATEAFEGAKAETDDDSDNSGRGDFLSGRGLDIAVFLAKTGNSFVLHNGEEFIVFGSPNYLSGESISELKKASDVNGAKSEFSARTVRKGSHCQVEVAGKIIHQAYIFGSLPVLFHGKGVIEAPVASRHRISSNTEGLISHGLVDSLAQARVRPTELSGVLKKQFTDWNDADLKKTFPGIGGISNMGSHGLKLPNESLMPLISAGFPEVPAMLPIAKTLGAASGDVTFNLLIPVEHFAVKSEDGVAAPVSLANSADTGIWQIEVRTTWSTPADNQPAFEVRSLSWRQPLAEDAAAVQSCFLLRHEAFSGTRIYGDGKFSPAYSGASGPCSVYAEKSNDALFANEKIRHLIGRKFAGITGDRFAVEYRGWDTALRTQAILALKSGANITESLDPSGASPLISNLSLVAPLVASEAEKHPQTKDNRFEFVNRLAVNWAFAGLDVEESLIARTLTAIANAMDPFASSVNSWIEELARNPASQEDQIAFATSITEEQKQAVRAVLVKADAHGLKSTFDSSKLKDVVQNRKDVGSLTTSWNATLDAINAFKARDLAKTSESDSMTFRTYFSRIASTAITEDWQSSEFSQADEISALAQKKTFCERHKSTVLLINCIGEASFSKGNGNFFSPEFGGRYGSLANDFVKHHATLAGDDFGFLRRDLESDFFGPVWKKCDQVAFAANRQTLTDKISAVKNADFSARYRVSREISELLDQCR